MARDLDASSSAQDLPTQADSSRGQSDSPADSARSIAGGDGNAALAVPKQAMAAALGPRQTSEADTETGDVPMPWWYTPRRLLVRHLTQALWYRLYKEAWYLHQHCAASTDLSIAVCCARCYTKPILHPVDRAHSKHTCVRSVKSDFWCMPCSCCTASCGGWCMWTRACSPATE